MKAEEMFEALGYTPQITESHLLSYKKDVFRIWFNLSTRVYFADMNGKTYVGINKKEHQAITQQMKELRWIE